MSVRCQLFRRGQIPSVPVLPCFSVFGPLALLGGGFLQKCDRLRRRRSLFIPARYEYGNATPRLDPFRHLKVVLHWRIAAAALTLERIPPGYFRAVFGSGDRCDLPTGFHRDRCSPPAGGGRPAFSFTMTPDVGIRPRCIRRPIWRGPLSHVGRYVTRHAEWWRHCTQGSGTNR